MKLSNKSTLIFYFILLILLLLTFACKNGQESDNLSSLPELADTFTFFGVGKNSIVSKTLKKDLKKQLGSYAVESKNVIDLEINYKGFLKEFFPEIDKLNQQLNFPPQERIEHNTVKLMFRYARMKNLVFDYVEFVFSEYTHTPVFIKIHFKKDELKVIKTLEEKYGLPETIHWSQEKSKSLLWEKEQDLLILSFVPDQFGRPRYQIVIYFTDELSKLHKAELAEKEKKQKARRESSKTAF